MTDPRRPLILITRPLEDARPLKDGLEALGFECMIEPMLTINLIPDAPVDLTECRGILFTSANGVRAFTALTARRDLPVMAVGSASAKAAQEVGFEDVDVAGGNSDLLAERVRAKFDPGPAPFFHAAGSVTAGDLKGVLEASGYAVTRVPLYAAEPATALSSACRDALDSCRIDAVSFFSPRTAKTFVRLLQDEGRASCARTLSALCLSEAVAHAIDEVEWARKRTARMPETSALIAEASTLFPSLVSAST